MEQKEATRWFKVSRVDTRGKILDITDPDPHPTVYDPDDEDSRTPKFAMNYTKYNTSTYQSEITHRHWIDQDNLRLLAYDMLNEVCGIETEKGYKPILDEFKGGSAKAAGIETLGENAKVSRRMSVVYNDKLDMGPVYQIHFILVEGQEGKNGQIEPVKGATPLLKESVNIPVATARRIGIAILHYLQAKQSAALVNHWAK